MICQISTVGLGDGIYTKYRRGSRVKLENFGMKTFVCFSWMWLLNGTRGDG